MTKRIIENMTGTRKLKEERQEAEKELEAKRKEIFERWKEVWKSENNPCYNLEDFYNLFVSGYEYTCASKDFNKLKNEQWKKCFVAAVILGIGYVVWIISNTFIRGGAVSVLLENSLFLIPLVMLGGVVSKWIDIKKYQETWSRHSRHQHLLLTEMLKFISALEPYDCSDKRLVFTRNVLCIWENNQMKFVQNMENKEKGLMDIFEKIR